VKEFLRAHIEKEEHLISMRYLEADSSVGFFLSFSVRLIVASVAVADPLLHITKDCHTRAWAE
jgi:hypothetical protein